MTETRGRSLQPCCLCSALKKEIELCNAKGESERQELLNFLLKGHQEACHGLNDRPVN